MPAADPLAVKKEIAQALPNGWDLVWMGVGVLFLVWLTFRVRAWFRDDDAGSGHATDLLTDMRELHRQGGLSEEEFRLIKSRLVRKSPVELSSSGNSPKGTSSQSADAAGEPPEEA